MLWFSIYFIKFDYVWLYIILIEMLQNLFYYSIMYKLSMIIYGELFCKHMSM